MKIFFPFVLSVFCFLNSSAQSVGGWGTCEFATIALMNAFDPSSNANNCKKAFVQATNDHYRWDGSQWIQEDSQNIYNADGTLDANRTVNLGSYNLTFNGTNDIIFEADGDVGIGTLSPNAKLDINGVSLLRNGSDWQATGNGQLQFSEGGTVNRRHSIKSRHHNSNNYNALDFYIWENGTDALGALGTRQVMSVTGRNSGSVGIGTLNPNAKLEVSGGNVRLSNYGTGTYDEASPARILGVQADGDVIEVQLSSSNLQDNIYNINGTLTGNRTMTMGSNDLTLTGSGDYTFQSSGNFGIGVASSGAKLEVDGMSLIRNGSDWRATGDGQLQFSRDGTTNFRHVLKSRHHNTNNNYNSLDFYVWDQSVDAAADLGTTHAMSISAKNSGSVGIGTLVPDAKLDVTGGNVRFSDYGTGTYDEASPARILGVQADGDVVEVQLSASNLQDNIYNINGTLTGNRTMTMGSNDLTFTGSGDYAFQSSGNFGIGIASAGAKLDVDGVGLFRNGSTWQPIGDGQLQFGFNGNATYRHSIKTRHHSGNNNYNSMDFYTWEQGVDAFGDLGTRHVMSVSAKNSGSVGVGTLVPQAKFDVNGGNVRFSDYGTGTYDETSPARILGVQADGDVVEVQLSASNLQDNIYNINGTLTGNRTMTMGSNDLTFTGSGDYAFQSSGNFGIGIASAGAKLDVDGVGLLRNGSSWQPTGDGQLQFGYNGDATYRHSIKTRHHSGNNNYNSMDFYTWEQGVDVSGDLGTRHVMSVSAKNSGSVGVGTLVPNAKLEVNGGNVRFSDYGTGTYDEVSPARILGVQADGDVVEVELSASNLQDNIYNIDGTLTGDRTVTMSSNDLLFTGSGDYTFRSSGNFGIGIASAGAKLDVDGVGLLRNGSSWQPTGDGQLQFGYNGDATYRHSIKTRHHSGNNNYNSMDFYTWEQGVDVSGDLGTRHVMSVSAKNSGSVGVGTLVPNAKLEVNGGNVRFSDYGTGTYDDASPARVLGVQADGDIIEILPGDLFAGSGGEQKKFTPNENIETTDFWLSNDGDDEGVYIDPDGNVGVGTKNADAMFSVGGGTVAFEDYGSGSNAKGKDTYMLSVNANGDLQEMNTAKNARIFYPPAVAINASSTGAGSLDLYNQYRDSFTRTVISSPDAAGIPIPSYGANELHYYITEYDTSVFSNVAISNAGLLTYTVDKVVADDLSYMTIVFVVK